MYFDMFVQILDPNHCDYGYIWYAKKIKGQNNFSCTIY